MTETRHCISALQVCCHICANLWTAVSSVVFVLAILILTVCIRDMSQFSCETGADAPESAWKAATLTLLWGLPSEPKSWRFSRGDKVRVFSKTRRRLTRTGKLRMTCEVRALTYSFHSPRLGSCRVNGSASVCPKPRCFQFQTVCMPSAVTSILEDVL